MKLETYTKIDKNGKEVEKQRYPKLYGKHRKEQKRQESQERADGWRSFTIEQKLNSLNNRPGECRKQKEKLLKGLESGEKECIMEIEKGR